MAGKSNRPLNEQVFDAWKNAKSSERMLASRKEKLAKLSSNLDDAGVNAVKKMIADFEKGDTTPVEGKISL